MEKAMIFNIQRFSLHDGPGIRTLIFLKGCSLRCKWCANPEGIYAALELRYHRNRCRKCYQCVAHCPFGAISAKEDGIFIHKNRCRQCGVCMTKCMSNAIDLCGKEYTVEELYQEICREVVFYRTSGGGVTLGGGEPLLQSGFAVEFLKKCQENKISTAIETAGEYPWENLERVAQYCDIIHFDIKGWNPKTCLQCIGTDNQRITDNLTRLDEWIAGQEIKPKLIVRTPLLPGYNYTLEDYEAFAEFIADRKSVSKVDILPFHNLGEYKYEQLGREYDLKGKENLKEEDVREYEKVLLSRNIPVTITTF